MIWLLFYAAFIIHLSLFPWRFEPAAVHSWTGFAIHTRGELMDSAANLALYLPLGAALYRRFGFVSLAAAAGAVLSFGLEWSQLFIPNRNTSLRDLAFNAAGALLGAFIARLIPFSPSYLPTGWRLGPVQVLFVSCWALWTAFPFVPVVRMSRLVDVWRQLTQPEGVGFLEAGDMFLSMLTLARVLPHLWLTAAFALLPLQGLFLNQMLSLGRVFYGMMGACAGLFGRLRHSSYWLAATLCLWLAARELYPFHFQASEAAFSWAPFESMFSGPKDSYYRTVFGKLFIYLATVWSLRECALAWRWTGLIPFTTAFVGEWLQRYLPGRTPELTEPALAALAFLLMRGAAGRSVAGQPSAPAAQSTNA